MLQFVKTRQGSHEVTVFINTTHVVEIIPTTPTGTYVEYEIIMSNGTTHVVSNSDMEELLSRWCPDLLAIRSDLLVLP